MSTYRFETLQLHVGQETPDPVTDARAVPIYATTSYIYGRLTNSTQDVLERRIAALALSSGAAAIAYTLQALGQNGGHIVAQKTIYGGSYNLMAHTLPGFGIKASFVNIHDLNEVEAAIKENTRAIYIETLGNPNSDIPDIDALAGIAHKHGLPLVVDNTFGTPYFIRPIEHGADIVVHSATKFLGGHGTTLGGIIVDAGKFDWAVSGKYPVIAAPNPSCHGVSFVNAAGPAAFVTYIRVILLRDTGASISPFAAFLLLQGIETLSLRLERHAENTKKVVEFLKNHSQVEKVNHPSLPSHPDYFLYQKYFPNGGASIFTFDIKGGKEEAYRFIDHLQIFSLLANVADVKSLVIHPATTTHSQLSPEELEEQEIKSNTIRLSIGTENIIDIIERIMPVLSKNHYVEGVQGKGGGYRLAKEPKDYRIGDILRLTEGQLVPVACLECNAETCKRANICKTLPMWKEFHHMVNNYFDNITLSGLMKYGDKSKDFQ